LKLLKYSGLVLAAAAYTGVVPGKGPAIEVKDLTPKFMTFYRAANAEHASPDRRFQLWKEDYDFAAVPPTAEGDRLARAMPDKAWPNYPPVITRIEKGAAAIEPSPQGELARVVDLLRPGKPIHLRLIVFVGGFENNTFTVGENGRATVAIPVEEDAHDLGPAMAEEFTHAVRIEIGADAGGWVRTVGETALDLGLALRVTQHLYPDRSTASFLEIASESGWLAKAKANRSAVLRDVRTAVASDRSEDVMRFTMGKGPSGLDREAYYAGWVVVGYWLQHGMTFAQIARIPEGEAPTMVRTAIDSMLTEQ